MARARRRNRCKERPYREAPPYRRAFVPYSPAGGTNGAASPPPLRAMVSESPRSEAGWPRCGGLCRPPSVPRPGPNFKVLGLESPWSRGVNERPVHALGLEAAAPEASGRNRRLPLPTPIPRPSHARARTPPRALPLGRALHHYPNRAPTAATAARTRSGRPCDSATAGNCNIHSDIRAYAGRDALR